VQAFAIALAVLMAGCTSGGSGKQPAEAPLEDGGLLVLPDGRAIAGVVTDTAFVPIANAVVRVLETELNGTTDADGFFAILGVEPGPHQVVAEAAGFRPRQQAVQVGEDRTARVVLLLEALPTVEPHIQGPVQFNGNIQCAMSLGLVMSCTNDPNHRAAGRFLFQEHPQALLVEVTWSPQSGFELTPGSGVGLAGGLTFQFNWETDREGSRRAEASMRQPPLRFLVTNDGDAATCSLDCSGTVARLSDEGGAVAFTITAQFPTLVYGKPFTVYHTLFYGMEAPPEFTALPP